MASNNRVLNPDIGVNALFLNQVSELERSDDGFKLREVEVQFSADVDSYFTASALIALENEDGEFGVNPEEVYAQTINIPNISLFVGKMKMPFGKHNQLHAHAFPFIDRPLINLEILGEEGLTDTGMGISWMLPISWFSEFTFFLVQGSTEELFGSKNKGSKVVVSRWKNLWDLNDATTLEWGVSFADGPNRSGRHTTIYGSDLTLKWQPTKWGKYRSFEWLLEFMGTKNRTLNSQGEIAGFVTHFRYKFKQRWWVQYRYDYLGLERERDASVIQRHTALISFFPSEFSGIQLQVEELNSGYRDQDEKRVALQFNMSLGAHPAHAY